MSLKTIYAVGGDGTNVNWPAIKIEEEKDSEGPGFFYNDCSEGVTISKASSTLTSQGSKSYGIKNLNDYNPMTSWVEGKTDYGIGEFIEMKGVDINIIYNGYQSTPTNWRNNSRVKKFKVYVNNKPICFLVLTDEMGGQHFDLPVSKDYDFENPSIFKFEIVEVYKGDKWADVAISELDLRLCCFSVNTVINASTTQLKYIDVDTNTLLSTIDLTSNELGTAEVLNVTSQIHSKLFKISTNTKSIEITSNHPLYVKNHGFVSLARLQSIMKAENYSDLINEIDILTWNSEKSITEYERLIDIEIIEGRLETFTIMKISSGTNYIANGFITKTY
jgi:hypothetical protein